MKIIKIIKTEHDLHKVGTFGYYGNFLEIRLKRRLSCSRRCFICDHKFKMSDKIFLGFFDNIENKIICHNCAHDFSETQDQHIVTVIKH